MEADRDGGKNSPRVLNASKRRRRRIYLQCTRIYVLTVL
jgi:hypothetical protein